VIFVTVGHHMPFDRLVQAVDEWAAERPDTDVFVQIGPGTYQPQHVPFTRYLDRGDFQQRVDACRLVVAHAGMGSILTALTHGRPILILPRRAALGEHRNDHQLATAEHLADREGITVAMDEAELATRLDDLSALETPPPISPDARPELIDRLRRFITTS
jgi:UDP-N-acetylglucosamine transferase subunit ALG13